MNTKYEILKLQAEAKLRQMDYYIAQANFFMTKGIGYEWQVEHNLGWKTAIDSEFEQVIREMQRTSEQK